MKKKAKQSEVLSNAYVVVASCNLDDVLLGVFQKTEQGYIAALNLAKKVADDPYKMKCVRHMAHDSGFVRSIVFAVCESTKFTQTKSFEEGGDGDQWRKSLQHKCACKHKRRTSRKPNS